MIPTISAAAAAASAAGFPKLTRSLLRPATQAALARLRAYKAPAFPLWDQLPASRRAAVLILLYADRHGDLRVVLTMRAASLRSFSGHAAFPGGKADSADESPYQIARREAFEEIGLPMDDSKLPAPFKLEFLCYLPHSLARNGLAVRPCVALLHNPLTQSQPSSSTTATAAGGSPSSPIFAAATAATTTATTNTLHASPLATTANPMVPRLDAKEVAAVFSAPFSSFLRDTDAPVPAGSSAPGLPPGHWYDGTWIHWKGEPWRVHNFYVPVNNQRVVKPDPDPVPEDLAAQVADDASSSAERYKVWGMTAKILVEAASCAYGTTPTFEHNPVWGDEKIILMAHDEGQFFDRPSTRIRVTGDGAPASGGDMTPTEEAVEEAKRAEPAKI